MYAFLAFQANSNHFRAAHDCYISILPQMTLAYIGFIVTMPFFKSTTTRFMGQLFLQRNFLFLASSSSLWHIMPCLNTNNVPSPFTPTGGVVVEKRSIYWSLLHTALPPGTTYIHHPPPSPNSSASFQLPLSTTPSPIIIPIKVRSHVGLWR